MRFFILLSIIFLNSISAQESDKSLLWEISGNNLYKPSYLYGTMHVSNKIAFRLDDVFYKVLSKSDVVALESDPSKWLDYTYQSLMLRSQNNDYNYKNNFYDNLFELKSPNDNFVRNSIKFDNRIINGYLYRKNGFRDNFEEETYLDMFIYQAGKKQNKEIIGLENIEESRYLTKKASYNARKKKINNWLLKLFEESSPNLLMENAYRERNITFLDSIGEAMNTNYYREHMLFKRNKNMVDVLDSIIRKKVVFAGVGAAHLSGEKGMINMLRERGYIVKPLTSQQTNFGETEKDKLNETFVKPKLTTSTTPDGFISIKSFDDLREFNYKNNKYYIAPNMANGAYLTVNRISTYEYLPKNKTITLDKIDHLLYEDIPGKIIERKKLQSPYPGISILNLTKKGDYQKYHIYKTPLEIIIIKFAGKKDFVLQHEKEIFNSLSLKPIEHNQTTYYSNLGNYSFKMPKNYISENAPNIGKKIYQSKDKSNYYFLQETPIHNTNYIEEDNFEAKYIVENFFEKLDLKPKQKQSVNNRYQSCQASAIIDSIAKNKLFLRSIVKDESYYLMGFVGNDSTIANAFFNSLKFHKINYTKFTKVKDTSLHFTVTTNTKSPLPYNSFFNSRKKSYELKTKHATYQTKANEKIVVTKIKYHDLQMFENIDSLWNSLKQNKKSYLKGSLAVFNEKKWKDPTAYYYSYKKKDTNSVKTILVKHIQKKGSLFTLKTLVDSLDTPSDFTTNFYKTFKPIDTLLGESVFNDKTTQFFKALQENDSIVLKGYKLIKFNNNHVDKIIKNISSTNFSEDKKQIRLHLIKELGKIKNPKTTPFLKQLYLNSYSEPSVQVEILKALLNNKNFKDVSDLLETDMPLNLSRSKLFNVKSAKLSQYSKLFPEILKFTAINEYKAPLYRLLSKLKDSAYIKPKVYKKYKSQIINDGKIEIKRGLSSKKQTKFNNKLSSYVSLIFPFRKEKSAISFFEKLIQSENSQALASYLILLKEAGEHIPNQLLEKVVFNDERLASLIKKAEKNPEILVYLGKKINQKDYSKSLIVSKQYNLNENDSISFYSEQNITTDDNKDITVYFYKFTKKSSYRDRDMLHFVAFEKEGQKLQPKVFYRSKNSGSYIRDGKTIDDEIGKQIKLIKHKKRKRINKRTGLF